MTHFAQETPQYLIINIHIPRCLDSLKSTLAIAGGTQKVLTELSELSSEQKPIELLGTLLAWGKEVGLDYKSAYEVLKDNNLFAHTLAIYGAHFLDSGVSWEDFEPLISNSRLIQAFVSNLSDNKAPILDTNVYKAAYEKITTLSDESAKQRYTDEILHIVYDHVTEQQREEAISIACQGNRFTFIVGCKEIPEECRRPVVDAIVSHSDQANGKSYVKKVTSTLPHLSKLVTNEYTASDILGNFLSVESKSEDIEVAIIESITAMEGLTLSRGLFERLLRAFPENLARLGAEKLKGIFDFNVTKDEEIPELIFKGLLNKGEGFLLLEASVLNNNKITLPGYTSLKVIGEMSQQIQESVTNTGYNKYSQLNQDRVTRYSVAIFDAIIKDPDSFFQQDHSREVLMKALTAIIVSLNHSVFDSGNRSRKETATLLRLSDEEQRVLNACYLALPAPSLPQGSTPIQRQPLFKLE
jgi:hypothetical protein